MAKDKEKARKKGRRAYLDDIRPNLAGEYVYTGSHYRYKPEAKSFRRALTEIVLLAVLSLASLLAAGCVRAGGMGNCFYVIIPYIAEAIAVFTLVWAVTKLLINGEKLREYIYAASVEKLPVRTLLSAIFAAAGTLCIIIFIILNGIDGSIGEIILLLVAKIVAIAAPLILRKLLSSLNWEKEL